MAGSVMDAGLPFDFLLAALIVCLGWCALGSRDLFRAIVFFVCFGLSMGLAWVRLEAPDVALAEVAVSAGLTGALLVTAFAERAVHEEAAKRTTTLRFARVARAASTVPLVGVFAGLAWATLSLPEATTHLAEAVERELAHTGASNPVTAVLLDFRGYDTLLELAVLLVALSAIRAVAQHAAHAQPEPGGVLWLLSSVQVPVMIVVAGYLLWSGSSEPGGAFQSGAILAAAGVLLALAGHQGPGRMSGRPVRVGAALGLAVFLATGFASMLGGRAFLDHSEASGTAVLLLIEIGATVSIALTLLEMFMSVRPGSSAGRDPDVRAAVVREAAGSSGGDDT